MLQAVAEWEAQAAERAEAYAAVTDGLDASATEPAEREFVAYVPLPEQEEIEARVRHLHAETPPLAVWSLPTLTCPVASRGSSAVARTTLHARKHASRCFGGGVLRPLMACL